MDEVVLRDAALEYHRLPTPGKISVSPTKGLTNQHDLSLAYSPGVAYACLAIRDDPNGASALLGCLLDFRDDPSVRLDLTRHREDGSFVSDLRLRTGQHHRPGPLHPTGRPQGRRMHRHSCGESVRLQPEGSKRTGDIDGVPPAR